MRIRRSCLILFFIAITAVVSFAQNAVRYRIQDVQYDITGKTREYPLSQAVEIDRKRVFQSEEDLKSYISDLGVLFDNQRVLASAVIDTSYGSPDSNGIVPVTLVVHTVDTRNFLALPYPKYDSNDGLNFKLKLKNYNFFGSMNPLSGELNYQLNADNESSFGSKISFDIPFKKWDHKFDWSTSLKMNLPFNETPELNFSTTLDYVVPIPEDTFPELHFGVTQSFDLNRRNSNDYVYTHDRYLFGDSFYVKLPFILHEYDYFGKLKWTPSVSVSEPWSPFGVHDSDLTGPDFSAAHMLSIGRTDWVKNFRSGAEASLTNAYSYNYQSATTAIIVSESLAGYTSFFDRVGLSARINGFYNFNDVIKTKAGGDLRGIMDNRIDTDTLVSLNVDMPIRILRVNFEEITGVRWTRMVGFEMQLSPFFDMALTHDYITKRYFSHWDGWYSGGCEVLVFPLKWRSFIVRASVGWDLNEVIYHRGKLTGNANRDGASIHEYSLGIGLLY